MFLDLDFIFRQKKRRHPSQKDCFFKTEPAICEDLWFKGDGVVLERRRCGQVVRAGPWLAFWCCSSTVCSWYFKSPYGSTPEVITSRIVIVASSFVLVYTGLGVTFSFAACSVSYVFTFANHNHGGLSWRRSVSETLLGAYRLYRRCFSFLRFRPCFWSARRDLQCCSSRF